MCLCIPSLGACCSFCSPLCPWLQATHPPLEHAARSFMDKEVQRDAKLVSYDIVEKASKPYISVDIGGEVKVFSPGE